MSKARTRITLLILLALAIIGLIVYFFARNLFFEKVMPIGRVQGEVLKEDSGTKHRSPYNDQRVLTKGVVHSTVVRPSYNGSSLYGFFIQSTRKTADKKPATSDGIYIMTGKSKSISGTGEKYLPKIGDEIVVQGLVDEYHSRTELKDVRLVQLLRSEVDLDKELETIELNPPENRGDAGRYWERLEHMRVRIPAGAIVQNGRKYFSGGKDSEFGVIRHDHPIALRTNIYARRVFRDAHPLDDIGDQLFDNQNPHLIMLSSAGIKGALDDPDAILPPARTFDIVSDSITGTAFFDHRKYRVLPSHQLTLTRGPDPFANHPPDKVNPREVANILQANMYNLYDYHDDPHDGCDFPTDRGCGHIKPPFNYIPESDEEYRTRLKVWAHAIITEFQKPDVILCQEVEDQDLGKIAGNQFIIDKKEQGDGALDVLQELALEIKKQGGPYYKPVADFDGAGRRGIINPFMYRTDRVEIISADPKHPVLGKEPKIDYPGKPLHYNFDVENPKSLNANMPQGTDLSSGQSGTNVCARPPQVLHCRIWQTHIRKGSSRELYIINNHFSSRPGERVGQRIEQARFNAALAKALQVHDPDAGIIVGGDLNVYPRPDDPFRDTPSDQLGSLYDIANLHNTWDTEMAVAPESAYSYIYQGQAGTLDQAFLSENLMPSLVSARVLHMNADWPQHSDEYPDRAISDHDPLMVLIQFPEQENGNNTTN